MSELAVQIWLALALDLALGDPRWLPHPVRLMGRAALALEAPARRRFASARVAGAVTAAAVVGGTAAGAWLLLAAAGWVAPWLADLAAVLLLYTTLAARDLEDHARAVLASLEAGDLPKARARVGRLVGRDTADLDPAGVTRAAVESVAENTVDGVLAPLFFAFLGGPVGAMAYKAASTLDSTFGYKSERYLAFGWASARLDDLLNLVPARLSVPLLALAAWPQGLSARGALALGWRDGRNHASPNSGFPEAAVAGALGVQLGGPVRRRGVWDPMPTLGDPGRPLEPGDIRRANALTLGAAAAAALLGTVLRLLWGP